MIVERNFIQQNRRRMRAGAGRCGFDADESAVSGEPEIAG